MGYLPQQAVIALLRDTFFVNDGPFTVYLKKEENSMKSTKRMWIRCLSVLLVLCMVGAFILPNIKVSAADTDADLWVDPVNGNDANDGLTEAKALKTIAAAKTKAEALLEQWESGEATEESFAALAVAESADPGSAANGGLYENVNSQSGFIAEFTDWAINPARKANDTGLVKNTESSTKGWHIMYFVGKNEPAWKEEARTGKANEDTTK